jgi:hypothetical protein
MADINNHVIYGSRPIHVHKRAVHAACRRVVPDVVPATPLTHDGTFTLLSACRLQINTALTTHLRARSYPSFKRCVCTRAVAVGSGGCQLSDAIGSTAHVSKA